jgi:ATP-dependent DNA helicase RecG
VQCGRFLGRDKAVIFDHIELYDHLPQAVDAIMLFLKKHAMRGADFSEVRRRDVWSIPLGILREAVINALVHADYSQRGAPVRIAFFDDRIEIENPGILLPGMTIDDMRQGISKIRNHIIARVFRELKLIEQWGSGVRRMFREAEEQGLPAPQILEVGMRMRFIVPLAEPLIAQAPEEQIVPRERPESRPESRPELQLESRLESQLAAKVLLRLQTGEAGKSVLAEHLGHRTVSGELKKQIKRLLDFDLIEMTIPDKPRSSKQRYRLTDKGRQVLEDLGETE